MAFLKSRLALFLYCVIAGSVSAYAMAPYNYWFLLFAGISTLYICLSYTKSIFQAFYCGWGFGFGYFVFGLSWIGNALLVDGNDYAWAWPLAVTGLPAVLALYYATASALTRFAAPYYKTSCYLVFVILFFGFEILRGHLFTGFPWNLFGYTWADVKPLLQSVFLFNVYGLTALTIFWGGFIGFSFVKIIQNKLSLGWLSLVFLAISSALGLYLWGQNRLETTLIQNHTDISIRIVQPNTNQSEKWERNKMQSHFDTLLHLSEAQGGERDTTFVIWPETALNPYIMSHEENKIALQNILATYTGEAYLISGALRREPSNGNFYNSLMVFNKKAENTQIYDKYHLVPFGEYIPFQNLIPLETVTRFSGFGRGTGNALLTTPAGLTFSPLICYEIIFPGKVVKPDAPKPDFIVNVTNDAWYGDSAGPYQHLTAAMFRAVEEGIPVIRAANTGISAIIDPLGNIRYKIGISLQKSGNILLPIVAEDMNIKTIKK